jgi:1-acyl-sn-glycerol-3-phosphate acyltransferase
VGKVIRESRAPVIPVFINGLVNDIRRQVTSNFKKTGQAIYVVFGEPLQLEDLLNERPSPRLYRAISERCLTAVAALGQQERGLRERAGEPYRPRQ